MGFYSKNEDWLRPTVNAASSLFGAAVGTNNEGAGATVGGFMSTAGDLAGMIPGPLGMGLNAGLKILGGLTNKAFGYKLNKENINRIEGNINQLTSFNSDAGSWDSFMSNLQSAPVAMNFNRADVGSDGWFNNGATRKYNSLMDQITSGINWSQRSLINNAQSINKSQAKNAELNYYIPSYKSGTSAAYGGPINMATTRPLSPFGNRFNYGGMSALATHGTDWNNGLKFINVGGSHEENPYEGVQMGVDQEGTPNLVEEGEVIWNDYVFSNRMVVPKRVKEKLGIKGMNDITYAEVAKKIQKEAEERPNDPISKRGLDATLGRLAYAQEEDRQKKQEEEEQQAIMAAYGGELAIDETNEDNEYSDGGKIHIKESKKGTFTKAATEHGTGVQEFANKVLTNKDNYSPAMVKKANFAKNAASWKHGLGGNLFLGGGPTDNDYSTQIVKYAPGINDDIFKWWRTLSPSQQMAAWHDWLSETNNEFFSDPSDLQFVLDEINSASKGLNVDLGYTQEDLDDGLDGLANPKYIIEAYNRRGKNGEVVLKNPNVQKYSGIPGRQLVLTSPKPLFYNDPIRDEWYVSLQKNHYPLFKKYNDEYFDLENSILEDRVGYHPIIPIITNKSLVSRDIYEPLKQNNNISSKELKNTSYVYPKIPDYKWTPESKWSDEKKQGVQAIMGENVGDVAKHTAEQTYDFIYSSPERTKAVEDGNMDKFLGLNADMARLNAENSKLSKSLPYSPLQKNKPEIKLTRPYFIPKDTKKPRWDTSYLRYAPVIGSAINVFTDLAGLTNKPDYSNADSLMAATQNLRDVRPPSIGDYVRYTPFDRLFYLNQLNANAGATRRGLMDIAGGNRGAAMAGLLASDYNTLGKIGELARQAEEYNLANRFKTAEFNRGTNQFNSEMDLKAQMANNQNASIKLDVLAKAAAIRDAIDARIGAARSANLTGLFDNLGAIGEDYINRKERDMLIRSGVFGTLSERPYGWNDKDWNTYKELLKKYNRGNSRE